MIFDRVSRRAPKEHVIDSIRRSELAPPSESTERFGRSYFGHLCAPGMTEPNARKRSRVSAPSKLCNCWEAAPQRYDSEATPSGSRSHCAVSADISPAHETAP